ncbi:ATP-binding protein [Undibacterium cyanobacteriorum]|uniref:histidine kinase n=1 Tax=Undibacterium cyanobacteriorum TaxID=3073561 RepID=A0ABY9RM12_9BURK|nr:ATP-binding protein [Undibacterium sp. 20NA77.5]WMW82250.1 ATP-binding protein [Undibacterium sp. 20NA77.5]
MDLYASSEELFRLESMYPNLRDFEKLGALVTITWYIRQRDCQRALFQLDEIEQLLLQHSEQTHRRVNHEQEIKTRLNLIRAEIHSLLGDLSYAEILLKQSKYELSLQNDLVGLGDAAIVEATMAISLGDNHREEESCKLALDFYQRCGDKERAEFAEAWLIYAHAFLEPEDARIRIERFQRTAEFARKPAIAAHIFAAEGVILGRRDPSQGARLYLKAANSAKQAGLIRLAIISAGNACEVFQNISDLESATQAIEFALSMAKQAGWPSLMGFCYAHLGRTQRQLGRISQSRQTLQEALNFFPNNYSGINKAIALRELGETHLIEHSTAEALKAFEASIKLFRAAESMDDLPHTLIRYARVLSVANQTEAALQAIAEAQTICERFNFAAITVSLHQVLAEIYSKHALPPPVDMKQPNAVIHFLEKALNAGHAIDGWQAPPELFTMLSDAWAEAADLQKALDYSKQALVAERHENDVRLAYKTANINDHHQTEKAQAEAQYHHLIAIAESNRARALQDTKDTLVKLSKIGQEITAKLESTDAFIAIHNHLQSLLDAGSFCTYLLNPEKDKLVLVYGVRDQTHISPHQIPLDHPDCLIVRSTKERKEFNSASAPHGMDGELKEELYDRSQLIAPLIAGDRLLGAMVIGSAEENAYSDREQLIFTTISAYAAIALDNAGVYQELQATQRELLQAIRKLEIARQKEQSDREKAEEATKLKSEFLANMSHEIRTPMNAVIGMAYLALMTDLNPKQKDYIKKIQVAASSLLGIINDILDFSKIEAGKLEVEITPFALEEVISQLSNITSHKAADKGLQLHVDIAQDLPTHFIGDPLRIGQVLMNLVNNAIKFTSVGEISVECKAIPHAAAINEKRLEFSVRDTGIGMTEEQKQRLFKPFTQGDGSTTRNYGGTGLGLSICKQLIELMGGEIAVSSEYGKGSCFKFEISLPVFQNSMDAIDSHLNNETQRNRADAAQALLSSASFNSSMTSNNSDNLKPAHILLAEDNEFNQEIAVELLNQCGFKVTVAQHGQEAIDILARHDMHHFDLILMDLEMPVLDGHNATIQIRSMPDFDHLPIIALTAHAMKGTKDRCVEEGMQDYLTKPFDPDALFKTIQHWLQASINETSFASMELNKHTTPSSELRLHSFDVKRGLSSVANNQSLYLKLLEKFGSTHHDLLLNDRYLSIENIGTTEFKREVHTLKGQAATLGANQLAQSCVTLESILEEKLTDFRGLQEAAALCQQLRAQLSGLLEELDQYFAINPLATKAESFQTEHIPFESLIEQLRVFLETANVEAVDFFQSHLQQFENKLNKARFTQLHHALDHYDFDRALGLLHEVL